ncbi:DNA-binding protein [Bacteroides xylanisolvens]|uniref:DNA-binding protein n=1 Tax=Bacteroides xylanisolvens TaxID=371601 RepID=UPI0023081721|nr:DNA-binding protein [Bacteroides xylanisolvens]MDB0716711.1 DNA-binding protein [Bacteroides xylanisolvens]MDB0735427.1 DNA-binding protein [Bacteroides xylanisolvens]
MKILMLKAIGLQIRLNGEYFSDHQIMQRSDFQGITGMVRSTAMIHIRRLRQEGKPQNIGIPSQPIYVPAPGFYGKSRDYQPVK